MTSFNHAPSTSNKANQPSLTRLMRQLCFVPMWHSKWLTKETKKTLSTNVSQAEQGHRGEVVLIIENHLPIRHAYHENSRVRAIELFSQYRVWDTEENTGVLVYVNICEHDLEIVADRGINQRVDTSIWQQMCDEAIHQLKQGSNEKALSQLLDKIGALLRQHYASDEIDDPEGNELSDELVHLM